MQENHGGLAENRTLDGWYRLGHMGSSFLQFAQYTLLVPHYSRFGLEIQMHTRSTHDSPARDLSPPIGQGQSSILTDNSSTSFRLFHDL
jgi:hypothetical protein